MQDASMWLAGTTAVWHSPGLTHFGQSSIEATAKQLKATDLLLPSRSLELTKVVNPWRTLRVQG
ncbi:MAG: hypothetical protein K2X77_07150 [Candidatus Obscuribacterales bacterium]|nr:hypothetical protein [Candidatus Obscuribacterales bacterium]